MASVYADPKLRSKRTYIAVSSFNNQLYTYTTAVNPRTFETTGSLGATTGATAANSPRGHFLRETGARLYPGANPGISTLMVGVYDADSGLRGYIDPNAPIFAVFNSDKPVEMVDGGDNNTATPHKGQPVFTSGDVIAGGQIRSYTSTALPASGTNSVDFGVGQVYTLTPTAATTINASPVPPVGSVVYLVVTTSGTTSYTVTFGTGIKDTGNLATGTADAKVFTVTFVSDGTNLNEVARTVAM